MPQTRRTGTVTANPKLNQKNPNDDGPEDNQTCSSYMTQMFANSVPKLAQQ